MAKNVDDDKDAIPPKNDEGWHHQCLEGNSDSSETYSSILDALSVSGTTPILRHGQLSCSSLLNRCRRPKRNEASCSMTCTEQ